ncbi:DUF4476 domain-containing protein [Bacteroides sp. 51]|uniref:DUF4476 domain-containing protein n=1 Tax=Bacteroides sp. 51 TaxID=2302938 RepID=UPI0013D4C01E|nr:DUF4476 domain-containing protein [Bacteroides sp. 51]NDV83067.1 DUF4476 domain-containing protein [Bacteroides sp. 51]
MRKYIVLFCLSLLALSMYAASIYGIRIESDGRDMIVFVDGQQVCTPTTSCFIANLKSGLYKIEVFESVPSQRKGPGRTGELLFRDRIYYNEYTMKDISVRGNNSHHAYRDNIMPPDTFAQFLRSLKDQNFDDNRDKLLATTMVTSDFTSEQYIEMAKIYTFDKGKINMMKTVYPRIVDKQNFFMVIETLTFKMDKDQIHEFVKEYHQR